MIRYEYDTWFVYELIDPRSKAVFYTIPASDLPAWLVAYPRKLVKDVAGMFEPPLVTWNDFERAPYWPDSVVAQMALGASEASILSDPTAPVVSSIKPDLEPLYDKNGREVKIGDTIRKWWGYGANGPTDYRLHKVIKRDVGTVYEKWTPDDCWNHLRGTDFELVAPHD